MVQLQMTELDVLVNTMEIVRMDKRVPECERGVEGFKV